MCFIAVLIFFFFIFVIYNLIIYFSHLIFRQKYCRYITRILYFIHVYLFDIQHVFRLNIQVDQLRNIFQTYYYTIYDDTLTLYKYSEDNPKICGSNINTAFTKRVKLFNKTEINVIVIYYTNKIHSYQSVT